MSGRLKMKRARLAVGYARGDYRLTSDLPAGCSGVGKAFLHLFALVTLLEDLDFSFQFLRVAPGAAEMNK